MLRALHRWALPSPRIGGALRATTTVSRHADTFPNVADSARIGNGASGVPVLWSRRRRIGVSWSFGPVVDSGSLGHWRQTGGVVDDVFPPGFFEPADRSPDDVFYAWPRLVTHIDEDAIAAVGALYDELGITGAVLDLMGSWVSHFRSPPARLTVLGMNAQELDANRSATTTVVHDLNIDPRLPFADASFDAAVCCVSVDYLTRPIEVFRDVARVLRPGGPFVCTFSNRCFPSKAIRGWLFTNDAQHSEIVERYFLLAGGWGQPHSQLRTPPAHPGDPLLAVWAYRTTRTEPPEPNRTTTSAG